MYILVNKDLDMSIGKVAAQVAHAVCRTTYDDAPHTVVVLQATTEQLRNLSQYLWDHDKSNHLYIDEGVNEIPPYSITCLAVEPIDDDDDETRELFQGFELLREKPNWWRGSR